MLCVFFRCCVIFFDVIVCYSVFNFVLCLISYSMFIWLNYIFVTAWTNFETISLRVCCLTRMNIGCVNKPGDNVELRKVCKLNVKFCVMFDACMYNNLSCFGTIFILLAIAFESMFVQHLELLSQFWNRLCELLRIVITFIYCSYPCATCLFVVFVLDMLEDHVDVFWVAPPVSIKPSIIATTQSPRLYDELLRARYTNDVQSWLTWVSWLHRSFSANSGSCVFSSANKLFKAYVYYLSSES